MSHPAKPTSLDTYQEIQGKIVRLVNEQGGLGRAGYGEELIPRLAEDLPRRFGRGFSVRNLKQMRKFHLLWPMFAL